MPIYEYACSDCSFKFEVLVRPDTKVECPSCHSKKIEKLLSVFATTGASATVETIAPSPCDACGHPGGPGACALG